MKYNKEFKAEALKLSDEIGVKKAAQQLGLPYYTPFTCTTSRPRISTFTALMSALSTVHRICICTKKKR